MSGYELVDKIDKHLRKDKNMSDTDAVDLISFFGFNEESSPVTKIGLLCRMARDRVKSAMEQALVYGNYEQLDKFMSIVDARRVE